MAVTLKTCRSVFDCCLLPIRLNKSMDRWRVMILIWINLVVTLNIVVSEKVATYFLNSDYTFLNHLPNNQKIDCVHTDHQNVILLTQSITVCYRSLPFLYTGNNGFYLATQVILCWFWIVRFQPNIPLDYLNWSFLLESLYNWLNLHFKQNHL